MAFPVPDLAEDFVGVCVGVNLVQRTVLRDVERILDESHCGSASLATLSRIGISTCLWVDGIEVVLCYEDLSEGG